MWDANYVLIKKLFFLNAQPTDEVKYEANLI